MSTKNFPFQRACSNICWILAVLKQICLTWIFPGFFVSNCSDLFQTSASRYSNSASRSHHFPVIWEFAIPLITLFPSFTTWISVIQHSTSTFVKSYLVATFEGACNIVGLEVKWVANTASVLIKDKGNIFLYSKGTFLVNHLINSATLLGISDFLHVRMFLQINGHSLIIFTILYNYKTENLVHFFNTTTFGLFYNLFGNGVTSL